MANGSVVTETGSILSIVTGSAEIIRTVSDVGGVGVGVGDGGGAGEIRRIVVASCWPAALFYLTIMNCHWKMLLEHRL